jgi:hypothetical protein
MMQDTYNNIHLLRNNHISHLHAYKYCYYIRNQYTQSRNYILYCTIYRLGKYLGLNMLSFVIYCLIYYVHNNNISILLLYQPRFQSSITFKFLKYFIHSLVFFFSVFISIIVAFNLSTSSADIDVVFFLRIIMLSPVFL